MWCLLMWHIKLTNDWWAPGCSACLVATVALTQINIQKMDGYIEMSRKFLHRWFSLPTPWVKDIFCMADARGNGTSNLGTDVISTRRWSVKWKIAFTVHLPLCAMLRLIQPFSFSMKGFLGADVWLKEVNPGIWKSKSDKQTCQCGCLACSAWAQSLGRNWQK